MSAHASNNSKTAMKILIKADNRKTSSIELFVTMMSSMKGFREKNWLPIRAVT